MSVDMIEHIDIDKIEPPVVFIDSHECSINTQLQQLPTHTLIGTQIVKTTHAHLMRDRAAVLAIMVDTPATAHTTGCEEVQTCRIVVTI